jgi:hypothetical protein
VHSTIRFTVAILAVFGAFSCGSEAPPALGPDAEPLDSGAYGPDGSTDDVPDGGASSEGSASDARDFGDVSQSVDGDARTKEAADDGGIHVDGDAHVVGDARVVLDAHPEGSPVEAGPVESGADGADNGGPDAADGGQAGDARLPAYPVVTALSGSGRGQVISNDGRIQCGTSCTASFDQGAVVTLSAVADAGSIFAGWSLPECPGTGACSFTVSSARSVGARFFRPVHFSDVDKSTDVTLSPDRLGMQQVTLGRQGVRSDVAVSAGSGVFYFEAQRYADWPFVLLGVVTAAVPLDTGFGDTDQLFGIDTGGTVTGAGTLLGNFDPDANDRFGFVVDYRATHPIVHLILLDAGAPKVAFSAEMSTVTAPLYIFAGGLRQKVGIQASINPGNDTTNFPFVYDPKALLVAAGIPVPDVVLGWGDTFAGAFNQPPTIAASADPTIPLGSPVTVTATATDKEEGDLTTRITWADLATPLGARTVGAGGTFSLVPNALGVHLLQASIVDNGNKIATATVRVNVTGTLPVANPVQLAPDAMSGAGIVLSNGGLSARFTASAKLGIRANQGLLHGFQYFEIHREIPVMNMGGGLVIANGNLNPYGPVDVPPSCSVNVLGGTWHSLMFHKNFPAGFETEEYYGFAVDYRGATPVVYVIVRSQVVDTIALDDITVPIYPMLYGNPTVTPSGPAETINFGATPFHYAPATVLAGAGIDVTGFKSGWGG